MIPLSFKRSETLKLYRATLQASVCVMSNHKEAKKR